MPESPSEVFRTRPNHSESFGNAPQDAESFGILRNASERKEAHTLTVREVARMFEAAGVGRTERSVTNWCQPNKTGIARLDAYFDPNERKYFIAPKSVEAAIQEELARETAKRGQADQSTDRFDRKDASSAVGANEPSGNDGKILEQKILDLTIMNRGKDYLIEELRKEREGFNAERQLYVDQLMTFNHRVGELETRLNQIEAPADSLIDNRQSSGDS